MHFKCFSISFPTVPEALTPTEGGAPESGAPPTASPAEGALPSTDGEGPAGGGPALEESEELRPHVLAILEAEYASEWWGP